MTSIKIRFVFQEAILRHLRHRLSSIHVPLASNELCMSGNNFQSVAFNNYTYISIFCMQKVLWESETSMIQLTYSIRYSLATHPTEALPDSMVCRIS